MNDSFAATLGLLFPISFPGLREPILRSPASSLAWSVKLLRWTSVALLAVNHINTRNASIVGTETLSRIPENWNMAYRLANTDFGPAGTTKVLSAWTSCNDVDQVVHALVGVPSSQSAKIASTIANVYSLPVTSFGATAEDLADKLMYPTFSRTNAGATPQLGAMAGIIKYFGWDAFNILSDDTEFSLRQVSGLVKAAREDGIGVASRHIYSRKDTTTTLADKAGIESAVASLASAMYNSFFASRSRVTCLFSAFAEDIVHVLRFSVQQDIMSEGFVWLHLDSGMHLEDFADTIPNRRAVAGFLRMSKIPRSERIADRALHQAIDRSVMWHEAIDEFGQFMENHTALECDDCVPWQDKVFAESSLQVASTDAATFDWAYDAVWATAIGLVAAQQTDSDDVTSHIRSGGGKGGFQGASGVVAFRADGERAALGLTYNLENLQGPVDAVDGRDAWNDLKMQDNIVLLGTYEQSRGFERAIGAVPYWKGGRMGWDAPPGDFADAKIPDTAPTIVERVTVQKWVVETKSWSVSALASVVVPTVIGVLVMVCSGWYGYRHCTSTKHDEENESFVLSLHELRDKLQVWHSHVVITRSNHTCHSRTSLRISGSNHEAPPPSLFTFPPRTCRSRDSKATS